MAILTKANDRFNAIQIKIATQFFKDMERAIRKFIWENKEPSVVKAVLNNIRTVPHLKLDY
jgi:hypothetical protein